MPVGLPRTWSEPLFASKLAPAGAGTLLFQERACSRTAQHAGRITRQPYPPYPSITLQGAPSSWLANPQG